MSGVAQIESFDMLFPLGIELVDEHFIKDRFEVKKFKSSRLKNSLSIGVKVPKDLVDKLYKAILRLSATN